MGDGRPSGIAWDLAGQRRPGPSPAARGVTRRPNHAFPPITRAVSHSKAVVNMRRRFGQKRRRAIILVVSWAVMASVIGFITHAARSPDPVIHAQDEPVPPGPNTTPEPGATPDVTRPFWYVPYYNQERDSPKFEGTIAGISISPNPPETSGFDACPGTGLKELPGKPAVEAARSAGPLQIDDRFLPSFLRTEQAPSVWTCGTTTVEVSWGFAVEDGIRGVGKGGTGVVITRTAVGGVTGISGSPGRWSTEMVAGHQAAVMAPILAVSGYVIGDCYAGVKDTATRVLTQVTAGGTSDFCTLILEAVLK